MRNECLAQVENACEVDVHNDLPILGPNLHQLEWLRNAGVINEYVDFAEGRDGLLGSPATAGQVADIAANANMTRTEFLGRVLGAGGIKIEDSDAGAVVRENARWARATERTAASPLRCRVVTRPRHVEPMYHNNQPQGRHTQCPHRIRRPEISY